MSYNKLDFSTGALVNPYKDLQDTVGAGSIFAKIMTAKDEQASRDKELAEKKAEREAELLYRRTRDEKQDAQTALQNKRAEKQDVRVEKQDMEKLYTADVAGSMKRDLSPEGMSTNLTPEQINQLTVQASKIPGSTSTEDKATTDLYNQFVNANKANAAHVIKYGSELGTTDYSPSGSISTGETVQADPMVTSEITDKTIKELGQNYGMSIQSKSPNATISQLANKYKADTGLEADAKIQQVWQDAIDKKTQLQMQQAQLSEQRALRSETKRGNDLIKQAKADEEGERITAIQRAIEELVPGSTTELKDGKPVPKVGYTTVKDLEDRYDKLYKKFDKSADYSRKILDNPKEYLKQFTPDDITEGSMKDLNSALSYGRTDADKIDIMKKLGPSMTNKIKNLEYFGGSQIPDEDLQQVKWDYIQKYKKLYPDVTVPERYKNK